MVTLAVPGLNSVVEWANRRPALRRTQVLRPSPGSPCLTDLVIKILSESARWRCYVGSCVTDAGAGAFVEIDADADGDDADVVDDNSRDDDDEDEGAPPRSFAAASTCS